MTHSMSENELISKLEILKNSLLDFKDYNKSNIIFINADAFYSYIDNFSDDVILSKILIDIEQYIPLSLCIDNNTLEIYIKACTTASPTELKKLEDKFYKKARLNFINKISNANTPQDWQDIINACSILYNSCH